MYFQLCLVHGFARLHLYSHGFTASWRTWLYVPQTKLHGMGWYMPGWLFRRHWGMAARVGSIMIDYSVTKQPLTGPSRGTRFIPAWWCLPSWLTARELALSVQSARDVITSLRIVHCLIQSNLFIRKELSVLRECLSWTLQFVGHGMRASAHTLVQVAPSTHLCHLL